MIFIILRAQLILSISAMILYIQSRPITAFISFVLNFIILMVGICIQATDGEKTFERVVYNLSSKEGQTQFW